MEVEGNPAFETERLHVRRLTLDDLDSFHEIWGDPQVIFWGPSSDLRTSEEKLRDLVARRISGVADSGWFAVVRRADEAFVGDVVLEPASWAPMLPEIGWHIAAVHQGKGYATEAARALLDHARRQGLSDVWAKIRPDNAASGRVAVRIGMQRVGTLEHAGQDHDVWVRHLG